MFSSINRGEINAFVDKGCHSAGTGHGVRQRCAPKSRVWIATAASEWPCGRLSFPEEHQAREQAWHGGLCCLVHAMCEADAQKPPKEKNGKLALPFKFVQLECV